MKKLPAVLGVVLALIAFPAFAAIEYEFFQKTTTEDPLVPTTDLTARAVVDGLRTRVEFRGGTLYPPGTYAVTSDGRRMFFVDPENKSYTEVNMGGTLTALAASNVRIENFQSNVELLPDKQNVAGIDADHYRLTINYDITVRMGNIPLKQHVTTIVDSWTTTRFGTVPQDPVSSMGTTGNPQLDELLSAAKVIGFPLRQTVTTKTQHNLPTNPKSKLEVAPVRTSVREMWVSSIREISGQGISYAVPKAYALATAPDAPRSTTKVLTFEPEGKQ
jgi:hypothetical protein